jgi:hypothetical protein
MDDSNQQSPIRSTSFKTTGIYLLFVVIIAILAMIVYENKHDSQPVNQLQLLSLKYKLDSIHANLAAYSSDVKRLDVSIDSIGLKVKASNNTITNIYKTEVHEKTSLKESNDSINLKYFNAYIDNWIQSSKNK